MREIKFRVWNKEISEMWIGGYVQFETGNIWFEDEDGEMFEYTQEQMPLMQFTGLKDKNGKEIYEGDIVEASILTVANGKGVKGVVGYLQGQFDIDFHPGGGNRVYSIRERQILGHPNTIQDTVVGNIYENPELLEP